MANNKLSQAQADILFYLQKDYELTANFTEKDGYFDAAVESHGGRSNVRINTLKAMLQADLIKEQYRRPMGDGYYVVDFIAISEQERQEKRGLADPQFDYLRTFYHMPWLRAGLRVNQYNGKDGTVVGAAGHYVLVQLDSETNHSRYHPTWKMHYSTKDGTVLADYKTQQEER